MVVVLEEPPIIAVGGGERFKAPKIGEMWPFIVVEFAVSRVNKFVTKNVTKVSKFFFSNLF